MIPGTAAAQMLSYLIANPPGLSAIGTLDFVAGTYDWDGSSYSAAQVIDKTTWIGAGGLAVPASDPAGAEILLAPMKTRMATCQWSVLMEVELVETFGNINMPMYTQTLVGFANWIELTFWNDWFIDGSDGVNNPIAEDFVNGLDVAIHKVAATRINDKVAISVDGNTVVSDTTACSLPVSPMTQFYLGGYSNGTGNGNCNIRSISVYDPVTDAELVTLSTP